VEMDALWPVSPYSGNLYSREFFEMVARRLRPNGLMCVWAPTDRVRVGFVRTFPHVLHLPEDVLIGSRDPITVDLDTWRLRLEQPGVVSHLGAERAALVWRRLQEARPLAGGPRRGREQNEDLFPRDEFRHGGR
jgi:spermidine synthase